ncbi:hypothetical protein SNE40_017628 [Patella caerulea]|uniref:GPI mannosyltransferase 2 n=1 Tax=Patella caerulea TaxID=87958 RepID=A0AAN8PM88_PATCE
MTNFSRTSAPGSTPKDKRNFSVVKIALISRIAILFIQVVSNFLIPDHDADVFNPPNDPTSVSSTSDKVVELIFGGFKRWDAVYFQHVADYGYSYENTLAFFPLFPLLTRLIGNTILLPLQWLMSYPSVLMLSAFLLNNFLFIKSAQIFLKLGRKVLNEEQLAYKAAVIFCFNPASVFFSAPYSETLYCFLLLTCLHTITTESPIVSAFFVGLAALARSNGLVVFGFILHYLLKEYLKEMQMNSKARLNSTDSRIINFVITVFTTAKLIFVSLLSFLPFLLYQYYSYILFCENEPSSKLPNHIALYGRSRGYHLLGDAPSPWCYDVIPLSYSYVQKHHWNVGFLAYYEINQIPNFLLAAPIIVIGICSCICYFSLNNKTCYTLGLYDTRAESRKKSDEIEQDFGFKNQELFIYCAHLLFLILFGVFFIHIQVLTRLLCSSSPVIYWFIAYLITDKIKPAQTINRYNVFAAYKSDVKKEPNENSEDDIIIQLTNFRQQNIYFKLITVYFIGYFVLGTVAFSNFLPFT